MIYSQGACCPARQYRICAPPHHRTSCSSTTMLRLLWTLHCIRHHQKENTCAKIVAICCAEPKSLKHALCLPLTPRNPRGSLLMTLRRRPGAPAGVIGRTKSSSGRRRERRMPETSTQIFRRGGDGEMEGGRERGKERDKERERWGGREGKREGTYTCQTQTPMGR